MRLRSFAPLVSRLVWPFKSWMTCSTLPTKSAKDLAKLPANIQPRKEPTYPALFGIKESVRKADALVASALAELDGFGELK